MCTFSAPLGSSGNSTNPVSGTLPSDWGISSSIYGGARPVDGDRQLSGTAGSPGGTFGLDGAQEST